MYVGVLGKAPVLSLEELNLVNPTNVEVKGRRVFFNAKNSDILNPLGGVIKLGKIVNEIAPSKSLVGSNDIDIVRKLKNSNKIKRYKLVPWDHVNQEIAQKGEEFLISPFGIVKIFYRQPIHIYQTIDFERPLRGMKIGMMPSKLAHIMVNIARAQWGYLEDWTVYDPFVGFGTTGMVVNWLGGNFIGSDINISMAKANFRWWDTSPFYNSRSKITLFKHDVTRPFAKSFLKNINLIVSEGWLGPSLRGRRVNDFFVQDVFEKVKSVYIDFFKNLQSFVNNIYPKKSLGGIVSMPYYDIKNGPFSMFEELKEIIAFANLQRIDIYGRRPQRVKREIVKFLLLRDD